MSEEENYLKKIKPVTKNSLSGGINSWELPAHVPKGFKPPTTEEIEEAEKNDD